MEIKEASRPDGSIDVAKLDGIVKKQESARLRYTNEWRVNLGFYDGDQYVYVDPFTKRIARLRTEEGAKPEHRIRLVSNQIRTATDTRIAKATRHDPIFSAEAATTDLSDLRSARVAKALADFLFEECEMRRKTREVLLWSEVAYEGFAEVYWDFEAGKPIEFAVYPEGHEAAGEPIVNEEELEIWGDQAPSETVFEGEIGVEVLSPFELILLGGNTPKEAKAAIKIKGYDPDFVKAKWPAAKKLKADATADVQVSGSASGRQTNDVILVHQLYLKPGPKMPQGRFVVWSQNTLLHEGDFPYADGQLPFAQLRSGDTPGRRYGRAPIGHLVPLQKQRNFTLSKVAEYLAHVVHPQMLIPAGSKVDEFTDEPGGQFVYRPHPSGAKPEWRSIEGIPSFVFNYFNAVNAEMDDVSGLHEVSRGQTGPNVEAGTAIALLSEADETRIGPMVRNTEEFLTQVGRLMLARAKQFYDEERLLSIRGASGAADVQAFTASDLHGCRDIRVVPESMLPRSRAAEQQRLMEMHREGALDARRLIELSDLGPHAKELLASWTADKNRQQRELDRIVNGGQDFGIEDFDDHVAHMEVLDEWLKSEEGDRYREGAPQVYEAIKAHRAAHAEAHAANKPIPEPKSPSVNVQLRGDATPHEISEILRGQGVSVDPVQIAAERQDDRAEEAVVQAELHGQQALDTEVARAAFAEPYGQPQADQAPPEEIY